MNRNTSLEFLQDKLSNDDKTSAGETDASMTKNSRGHEALDAVMRGRLLEIPRLPPTTVKIYVCSNHSDFTVERDCLWREVLPDVQVHFLPQGLDVHLIDVHQGCNDDQALDTHRFQRHVNEIKQACLTSSVTIMLVLLGNKYGDVPLPPFLEEAEFTHIRNEAFESGQDVKMLDEWYVRDDNALPPVYALQPIKTKFPNYGLLNGHDDTEGWRVTYRKLVTCLQQAARTCHQEGTINQVHDYKQRRFFMSGVEQELSAMLERQAQNCIVFNRILEDINSAMSSAAPYIDVTGCDSHDREASKNLQNLRDKLASRVNDDNRHVHRLKWTEGGVFPAKSKQQTQYIDNFQTSMTTHLISLTENHIQNKKATKNCSGEMQTFYPDILSHLHYCHRITKQDSVLLKDGVGETITASLQKGAAGEHPPFLIYGPEGSGKTHLISHIASFVRDITGRDTNLIIRYIGLTPSSTSVFDLLHSLCIQIKYVTKQDIKTPAVTSLEALISHYHHLLYHPSSSTPSLVIILDGLDKLKTDTKLDWISTNLPSNIHMFITVTCVPSAPIFNRLISKLHQREFLLEMKTLSDVYLQKMLHTEMKPFKRTISSKQKTALNKVLSKSPLPMACKFMLPILLTASSRSPLFSDKIPHSVESLLNAKFDAIEADFGSVLVGTIMRYISSAHHGLSELELLDLLSTNNDILSRILHPDTEQIKLRFPVSIWIDIKERLGDLLLLTFTDKKLLLTFSHRCIADVVSSRYRVRSDEMKQSHRDIAELFLDTWVSYKPMDIPEKSIHITDGGYRFVCQQPFLYNETTYNLRRLNELWYQLLKAGDIDIFKEHTFCNFEYLLAKMHSTSVHDVLSDLDLTSWHCLDADIHLVLLCILQSRLILSHDCLQLASELIGRLRQIKDQYTSHISPLIQQAMEWCDSHTMPIMVPLSSWIPDPRKALITSLEVPEGASKLCVSMSGQHIFCVTSRNDIRMYHAASKTLVKTLTGHRGQVTCLEMAHNSSFLLSGSTDSTVRMWDVATGKSKTMYREHSDAVLCMALTKSDSVLVTGSKDKTFKVISLGTGDVLHSVREHKAPVTCLVLNKTDSMLVSASIDKSIKVWCMEDMSVLNVMDEDITSPVLSLALSVDNTFLLVGNDDGTLQVRSFTTGSEVHKLEGHEGKAESVVISADCFHCVAGCSDNQVYIYNLRTTELLEVLRGHSAPVTSLRLSTDGHFIFSAAKNQIKVWMFVKRFSHSVFTDAHTSEITCMAMSRDGKMCATGSKDKLVKTWSLEISDFSENLEGHEGTITCLAVASEEAFIVSGSEDGTVRVWTMMLGCLITEYKEHRSAITSVFTFKHNSAGHCIMSAEKNGFIHMWKAENGETFLSLKGAVDILQLSPNGQIGISGNSSDISLNIWQAGDGELIEAVSHTDVITCTSFSPDSQYVVTGSVDMSLKVWEALTGKLTQVLVEHEQDVTCAVITEGNKHILSGSRDWRLLVWGLSTGAVERQLIGHNGAVTCVRVTTDGTTAISASEDGTLRVWNINHGICITLFDMHYPVLDVMITHNAAHVVVNIGCSNKLPLLCLHNSPAGDVKSQSQISIQMADSPVLPVRPRPFLTQFCPGLPRLKKSGQKRFSVSTIPEIIKVSPIKAPLKKAVEAQEQNKENREHKASKWKTRKNKQEENEEKKSKICILL